MSNPGGRADERRGLRRETELLTFMKAYSLMAANRDMYIQLADWPFRR